MVLDPKQRQKKLTKKAKKRKELLSERLSFPLLSKNKAIRYADYPLHECYLPNGLFESGLGVMLLSRRISSGFVAVSSFVVDVYCLGIKNAHFVVATTEEYEHTIKRRTFESHEDQQFEQIHPSCARKIIEGAVRYASNLGFAPHPDYLNAKDLFGSIEADACPMKYTYGKDGKPLYIQGPYETHSNAKKIIHQLQTRCGEGNYHYVLVLDEPR